MFHKHRAHYSWLLIITCIVYQHHHKFDTRRFRINYLYCNIEIFWSTEHALCRLERFGRATSLSKSNPTGSDSTGCICWIFFAPVDLSSTHFLCNFSFTAQPVTDCTLRYCTWGTSLWGFQYSRHLLSYVFVWNSRWLNRNSARFTRCPSMPVRFSLVRFRWYSCKETGRKSVLLSFIECRAYLLGFLPEILFLFCS